MYFSFYCNGYLINIYLSYNTSVILILWSCKVAARCSNNFRPPSSLLTAWYRLIDIYTSGLPARLWKALSKMAEIWECLLMKLTADQYFLYYLRASDVQSFSYSSVFVSLRDFQLITQNSSENIASRQSRSIYANVSAWWLQACSRLAANCIFLAG